MKTKEEVLALFRAKYEDLKEVYPEVGPFVVDERLFYETPDGGWQLNLTPCAAITLQPDSNEAHETYDGICARWFAEGGVYNELKERGWLGYPISDAEAYDGNGDPHDRISHFEHGDIIWTAKTGATRILDVKGGTDNELSAFPCKDAEPHTSPWSLPPKAVKLKKDIEEKLDKIDEIAKTMLPQEGEIHPEWRNAEGAVREIRKKLQPYLNAFESNAFFIVTFGMLKAGKSTLVNALVGKPDVSPVGHGRETTKRSSIIFAADAEHPEGVYIYTPTDLPPDGDEEKRKWRKAKCEALLLALGGIGNIEDNFVVEKTEEPIYTLLTKKPKKNELPPVIRIRATKTARFPEENLLKDGVAILDTPGLDGVDANAKNDAFWQVLPAQGDFFLLVQSSMSGLNDRCVEQIREIYGNTENKPDILIVYNEIVSQFWLNDNVQQQRLQQDREEVEAYLRDKIKDSHDPNAVQLDLDEKMDFVSVNAGAASAAQFGNKEQFAEIFADNPKQLLDESHIGELTSKLRRMLQNSRVQIKINRLKGLMGKQVEEFERAIASTPEKLSTIRENEFQTASARREQAKADAAMLSAAFHDAGKGASIVSKIAGDVVAEFNKTIRLDTIDNDLKAINPAFENGWAPEETCRAKIREWIERVNQDFSRNLENSIAPGHAILKAHPWSGFCLPSDLAAAFEKIAEYLGREISAEDFRSRLLSDINPAGIAACTAYSPNTSDTDFPKPNVWNRMWGHGGEVASRVWDNHTPAVKAQIRRHFGAARNGGQNCPAATKLKNYIEQCVLRAGRSAADELLSSVSDKSETEVESEKNWNKQNRCVIDALQKISELARDIHKALQGD